MLWVHQRNLLGLEGCAALCKWEWKDYGELNLEYFLPGIGLKMFIFDLVNDLLV